MCRLFSDEKVRLSHAIAAFKVVRKTQEGKFISLIEPSGRTIIADIEHNRMSKYANSGFGSITTYTPNSLATTQEAPGMMVYLDFDHAKHYVTRDWSLENRHILGVFVPHGAYVRMGWNEGMPVICSDRLEIGQVLETPARV